MAFLLLGISLLGSCGWEVFKSFKMDSVWTRGGPRVSRFVLEVVFNAATAGARRADGEARADGSRGRIERWLMPYHASLPLRVLPGKQAATDAPFAPAAWLLPRPALGGVRRS
jgi:hypothetical protein